MRKIGIYILSLLFIFTAACGTGLPVGRELSSANIQTYITVAETTAEATAASSGPVEECPETESGSETEAAQTDGNAANTEAPETEASETKAAETEAAKTEAAVTTARTTSTSASTRASTTATTAKTATTAITTGYPATTPPAEKIVSGYYASWAAYSGYTPLSIPADKLTNIIYAFANIGDDLKIKLGDPDIDPSNFAKLRELKRLHPDVTISISIGGWTWSGKFSDTALTDASRTAFADSVVAFIRQYGFDGVDIDWEYPVGGGLSSNTYRPEDKTNFTLLMKKLRERLDAQGALDGKRYALSFAGGAGSAYIGHTELSSLGKYVDFATIMTYDMHGSWEKYTDFNSPLYTPSGYSPQAKISVQSTVNGWLSAGFPAAKLLLGVPLYGHIYYGVSGGGDGLYRTYTSGGSVSYNKIVSSYLSAPGYVKYFSDDAKVPWLFNGSTFISYDDADSVSAKADFARRSGLAGVCVWELSQDKNGGLLNALNYGLK